MSEHSKLPPSSAARRVVCPGSRSLEEKYPDTQQSPYASEGEAAHWVAAQVLQLRALPWVGVKNGYDTIWDLAPNGEQITDEMKEGAELYFSCVMSVIKKYGNLYFLNSLNIEKRIDISRIHPDCWGTPDCWLFAGNDLHIWDYKFGHGFVDVFENWQLIEYAAGILDKLEVNGQRDQTIKVYFYIVQPRNYHPDGPIRIWQVTASELRGYFNTLELKEHEASQPIAQCNPSPECNYCRARHACAALQQSALSSVDVSKSNTPWNLSPNSMGNELRYLKRAAELLDARITGLEEQTTALIKHGQRVPFFKLDYTLGKEVWKVDTKEVITLGEMLDCNLRKPQEAITPRQAAKRGLSEDIIKQYVERKRGPLKLVTTENNTARKIFGKET